MSELSEEEKKEFEELKSLLYTGQISQYGKRKLITIIENQQAELEKKDKMIDEMAEMITEAKFCYFKKKVGGELLGKYRCYNQKEWKEYFEKKVEEK